MKKVTYTLYSLFIASCAFAQDTTTGNPTPGGLRADGKIYVVAAVLLTILVGILIYVIRLDRKISRLERNKY